MSRPLTILLAAGLALTAFGRLSAQDPARPLFDNPAALFDRLDANKDGILSADEVPEAQRGIIERLLRLGDQNQDGKLSRAEFMSAVQDATQAPGDPAGAQGMRRGMGPPPGPDGRPPVAPGVFERMDKNHDGRVSADEFSADRKEAFQRILTRLGKDGLGVEEFNDVADELRRFVTDGPGPRGMMPPNGMPPNGMTMPGGMRRGADAAPPTQPLANPAQNILQRVMAMDKNNDGKISRDEAEGPLANRFDEFDANSDGVIDTAEIRQAVQRLAAGRTAADGAQANPTTPAVRPQRQ